MSDDKNKKILNHNQKIIVNHIYKNKNKLKNFNKTIPHDIDYLIIGGGIAGIACGLILLEKGKSFIIFEKSNYVGGVWNNALSTSELQTDRLYYKFKDYEYDKTIPRFPNKKHILEYLECVINKSNLNRHIYFGIKTVNYKKYIDINNCHNHNKWEVTFKINDNQTQKINCNHLVFCTGKNSIPNIPSSLKPYTEKKNDKIDIIHSSEFHKYYNERKLKQVKKMVIVGNGASACDILKFINNYNSDRKLEITMLYNNTKYFVKKKILGIPGSNMLSKRFLYFFENCKNSTNQFLINLANIFVFRNYLDSPKEKIQSTNIIGSLIINEMLNKRNNTTFTYLKDKIKDINIPTKSIILGSGEGIITDIDLLIFATGYSYKTIEYDFLYKYCIPVDNDKIIENCAYIGFNPKYNFIEECEKLMLFYLEFYENLNNLNKPNITLFSDINISNNVKKWYVSNKKRKDKNNLDFLDCTYELFE